MPPKPSRSGPPAMHAGPYDRRLHRPGTKGRAGRCSWTEDCTGRPAHTGTADYPSGKRYTWAVCATHHPDLLAGAGPTG